MHVDLGLLGKQVVDREARLQVDLVRGQRPHHARTQVGDPGHASERALLRVDQLTGRPVVAAGLAQPARTAPAELAGPTGTAVVLGRSEKRRLWQEWVRTCSSRWSQYNSTNQSS